MPVNTATAIRFNQIRANTYYFRPSERGEKRLYFVSDVSTLPGGKLQIIRWTSKGKEFIDRNPTLAKWEKKVEVIDNPYAICEWARPMKTVPHYKFDVVPHDDNTLLLTRLNSVSDRDMVRALYTRLLRAQ